MYYKRESLTEALRQLGLERFPGDTRRVAAQNLCFGVEAIDVFSKLVDNVRWIMSKPADYFLTNDRFDCINDGLPHYDRGHNHRSST